MATPAAVLSILVKADTKAAQAGLVKMDRGLKTTAGRMDGMDKSAKRSQRSFAAIKTGAVAAGGGLVLAGLAAKKAFREFEEAEKATSQTRAVLKSTGNAAKVTAAEIENLANKLSLKSGIDDEAIQSGENLLLTFTKIRNETGKGNKIFNEATAIVLDMSVALGTSLKSAAIQVGKALQDPENGITALRRVGVNFTKEQKERIQGWVAEGKQLKAQKFILKELRTEFAGSAAAQATGAAKLQVAFDNLFETFGKVFGPTLERGMEKLATGLQKVGDILGNPKLTNAEKFGRIMDMVVAQVEKALPKVTEVGTKVAGALAAGLAKGWLNLNPLGKLLTAGVLIRLVGGRGALFAAGTAIGKMFGAGFGAGASTAIVPGGKAAGAKGATAFLGGFRGILGKLGIAGLVAALFGPEVLKKIEEAGTHADAAGAEFEFASKRMEKLQKAGNMGGLIKAARDAQYTAKQMGAAGAPLKALADRMEFVGDATKRLRDRLERMRTDGARSVKELAARVQYNTGVIAQVMDKNSARGKRAMGENFAAAAQNVKLMMKAGVVSTKEGTRLIEQYMVKALQTMGFSKKEALMVRKGQDPYTGKAIGGKQNLTNKQRGGPINIGAASGDSVPAMLERGEYVLNRNAVGKVGRGNLDRLNFANAPRFQGGGWVGDSPAGLNAAVKSMALWAMNKYGASASDTMRAPGTLTSSGNVSDHTIGAAVDLTSGNMLAMAKGLERAFGPNIKQLIHTPLGYSVNNGQRVPAFAQSDHYDHVHLAAIGEAVKGMLIEAAPELNRIKLDGPDSMLKSVVQGGLDVTRNAAQSVLNQAAGLGGNVAFDKGGRIPQGVLSKSELAALWIRAGGPPDAAKIMAAVALAESGGDPNATGPTTSYGFQAAGLWQIHPPQPGSYDPLQNAKQAVAKYNAGGFQPWEAYTNGAYVKFLQKGGPVGYAGDSLGTGTAPLLKGILDQAVWSNSKVGRGSAAGVPILKGFDKASQLVFDLGTNDPNARTTHGSLLAASRAAGKRPLHFLTLLGGPDQVGKNKMFRSAASDGGHEYLTDYAARYKGGHDSVGHPSSYGSRARMLADSIKRAGKATTKPNKPAPRGKVKPRKHFRGLQAPSIQALHNAVEGMRYSTTEAGQLNARNHILDLIHGTGLPKGLVDKIDGLTEQSTILGDYADRAGQLTTEDAAGNVIPGVIGGRSEVDFLTDQLDVLARLRNRLVEAQEKLAARRAQIKQLLETAQKHFDYYQKAVVAWGHVIRVQEKKLEELRKHPKRNKKEIEQTRNLIMALRPEQAKTVFTRDALKDKIIPALKGKHGGLGDSRSTMLDSLGEVQGVGSPLTQMATLPALGTLGGSIFDTQMRMRELKLPPDSLTDTASDTLTSDRDDLLKEIGRLTLQRSVVEKLHEITLRDFPEFDRLGAPFGGKFHTGGIVPGPVGAEATTVLQGGEGVFTRDQMAAMGAPNVTINVAPGMEWLKQFISVEVGRTNRTTARNAGRGLPGRGGGNLG